MPTSRQELELVDLIYETALDSALWPNLLEGLADLLDAPAVVPAGHSNAKALDQSLSGVEAVAFPHSEDTYPAKPDEVDLFERLVPHFRRALMLKQQFATLEHEHGAVTAILDRIPVGVVLVDAHRQVLFCNRRAGEVLARHDELHIRDGALGARASATARRLAELIRLAAQPGSGARNDQPETLQFPQRQAQPPLSVLISPYQSEALDYALTQGCAAVLLASPTVTQDVLESALESLFGLTPAEARLAKALAQGLSLEQIAEQYGISKHTARAQLKAVFGKTGTSRQGELVKLILTSPAVLAPRDPPSESVLSGGAVKLNSRQREQRLRLTDGRRLGYAEYGDPQGQPVVFYHGMLGCRYQRHPDDRIAASLGVRLIIPDRPGFGLSTAKPGRSFLDWADDVAELADMLGIDRFGLIGFSVGGFYAAASAYKIPQRLNKVVLSSCMPPITALSDLEGMLPSHKMITGMARFLPSAAMRFMELTVRAGLRDPEKFFQRLPPDSEDRAVMSRWEMRQNFESCLPEVLRGGLYGCPWELVMLTRPWGFDAQKITVPVELWHGEDDRHAPIRLAQRLATRIPDCNTHYIPQKGHFLVFDYWRALLESAVS